MKEKEYIFWLNYFSVYLTDAQIKVNKKLNKKQWHITQ